ncbi:MAG: diphthine synthase [Conexivisphaerales archaeon]|nr:diphthine synthase [Conexivisphaerales archaeon]
MPLLLVGMGVHGAQGIPVGAVEELRRCDRVLLDSYTTPIDPVRVLNELRALLGTEVKEAGRDELEDVQGLLRSASAGCLGIVIPGDVFVATTHDAIRQEAARSGIEVRIWHSSSIVSSALSRVGLHIYKLGFIGTLVAGPPQTAYRAYFGVTGALRNSQHSILLMQHDPASGEGIDVGDGLRALVEAESSWRLGSFGPDRIIVIASRLFSESESVRVLRLSDALDTDFGEHPHTIIVPGRLHYTEAESMRAVLGVPQELTDAMGTVPRSLAARLASTAIEKSRAALPKFRSSIPGSPGVNSVLENVESYLSDAERFLGEGNVELALAEAGYAEGLLDSLRLLGYAGIEW